MLRSLLMIAASIVCITALHDDRIVGGQETSIEKFPHQVSLRRLNRHFCGGSIIRPQVVITAAHCLYGKDKAQISVLAGVTNKSETLDTSKAASVHYANQVFIHPGYSKATTDCDVGFIRLLNPIVYRPTAQPIPIAPVTEKPKHGEILLGTGWGLTEPAGVVSPAILRVAVLPVIDLDLCRRAYGYNPKRMTENMFCAGGSVNGQATYRGDSGGPITNRNRQLVGLVSWGKANNPLGYPKVFADLSSPRIRDFIDMVLTNINK